MLICLSHLNELSQAIVKSLITDLFAAIQKLIGAENWKIRFKVPSYFWHLSNVLVSKP